MKRWVFIFVGLGVLFWGWVALRLTHTLTYYSVTSDSNTPELKPGGVFFASRLKPVAYNNFVCFKTASHKSVWVFRCIGKPGDIIEIKNARVYRNGALLDEPYTNIDCIITERQLNSIKGYIEKNKNSYESLTDSTYKLTLSRKEFKAYHLNLTPIVSAKGIVNDQLFADFKARGYNEDNLGPVKIPVDSYFLMGDNRHEAVDSRYIGFIKKNEILETVLNH